MKTTKWIVTAAIVLAASGGMVSVFAAAEAPVAAPATAAAVKHQTICPIEGGEIIKSLYADYQGKRVYFCCNGCPAVFKKNPAKYIKEMESKGITLDKTP